MDRAATCRPDPQQRTARPREVADREEEEEEVEVVTLRKMAESRTEADEGDVVVEIGAIIMAPQMVQQAVQQMVPR